MTGMTLYNILAPMGLGVVLWLSVMPIDVRQIRSRHIANLVLTVTWLSLMWFSTRRTSILYEDMWLPVRIILFGLGVLGLVLNIKSLLPLLGQKQRIRFSSWCAFYVFLSWIVFEILQPLYQITKY
jgi:hypothetical protein